MNTPSAASLRGARLCWSQVITTECSAYFSWQTLGRARGAHSHTLKRPCFIPADAGCWSCRAGMFYSHRKSGQPGPITRIMCCTPEEYAKLPAADLELVPTHVAPSYTRHPRNGDIYSVSCGLLLAAGGFETGARLNSAPAFWPAGPAVNIFGVHTPISSRLQHGCPPALHPLVPRRRRRHTTSRWR